MNQPWWVVLASGLGGALTGGAIAFLGQWWIEARREQRRRDGVDEQANTALLKGCLAIRSNLGTATVLLWHINNLQPEQDQAEDSEYGRIEACLGILADPSVSIAALAETPLAHRDAVVALARAGNSMSAAKGYLSREFIRAFKGRSPTATHLAVSVHQLVVEHLRAIRQIAKSYLVIVKQVWTADDLQRWRRAYIIDWSLAQTIPEESISGGDEEARKDIIELVSGKKALEIVDQVISLLR